MKQIKSYTLEADTIERVKAVAEALRSSDSVAAEVLLNLGYSTMREHRGDVFELLGGVKNGEAESEV